MTFESRADFKDASEFLASTKFNGETIEMLRLGAGWRPWQYQVNCIQGTLHYTMANFRNSGDALRYYQRLTGDLK